MAYAQLRSTSAGTSRWYAIYFTADGRQRSGGGFSTKRDAERAAVKLEERAAAGTLADASRGKLTFAAYIEKFYWPAAQHLEPTTLAAYRSNLDSHFLPHFGRVRMTKIVASTVQAWVNAVSAEVEDFDGSRKPQLSPRSVAQIPHVSACDLRAGNHRPGHHDQPVRAHGVAEVRQAAEEGDHA